MKKLTIVLAILLSLNSTFVLASGGKKNPPATESSSVPVEDTDESPVTYFFQLFA